MRFPCASTFSTSLRESRSLFGNIRQRDACAPLRGGCARRACLPGCACAPKSRGWSCASSSLVGMFASAYVYCVWTLPQVNKKENRHTSRCVAASPCDYLYSVTRAMIQRMEAPPHPSLENSYDSYVSSILWPIPRTANPKRAVPILGPTALRVKRNMCGLKR